jgi:hypothetical protein
MWRQNKGIIILVLIVGTGYGVHMLYRDVKIRQDSTKRAAEVVHLKLDDDDVTEIGYISSMRNEVFLRDENRVNLVWFVKVPATGAEYSCSYEYGLPDFRQGDDVRIIHSQNVGDEAGYGYIVGLHYKLTGRTALVWVIDEENLELDRPEPDPPEP